MLSNEGNINKGKFGSCSKNSSIQKKLMYIFSFNGNFRANSFEIENTRFKQSKRHVLIKF